MNLEHFQKFNEYLKAGRRQDAKVSVQKFIDSFQNDGERELWVKEFLKTAKGQKGIFFPLYKEVIFPILAKGFRRNDIWSILWLARTSNDIAKGGAIFYNQVDNFGALGLLLHAYDLDSTSEEVAKELLRELMEHLSYCFHEWPAGVLNGMNGATLEECEGVEENIDLALQISDGENDKKLLHYYKTCLNQYRDRLVSLQ